MLSGRCVCVYVELIFSYKQQTHENKKYIYRYTKTRNV